MTRHALSGWHYNGRGNSAFCFQITIGPALRFDDAVVFSCPLPSLSECKKPPQSQEINVMFFPSGAFSSIRFLGQVLETCMATVGRVSNVDHNKRVIGKAGRNRWLGKRPSSGLWHRKGGWAGRKIRPLPPMKSYVKLPSAAAQN